MTLSDQAELYLASKTIPRRYRLLDGGRIRRATVEAFVLNRKNNAGKYLQEKVETHVKEMVGMSPTLWLLFGKLAMTFFLGLLEQWWSQREHPEGVGHA